MIVAGRAQPLKEVLVQCVVAKQPGRGVDGAIINSRIEHVLSVNLDILDAPTVLLFT